MTASTAVAARATTAVGEEVGTLGGGWSEVRWRRGVLGGRFGGAEFAPDFFGGRFGRFVAALEDFFNG